MKDLVNAEEVQKLRHPLYGALLYSPLYLLVDKKLTHNAWSQQHMVLVSRIIMDLVSKNSLKSLQLSKALGNEKPDLIVKLERGLWRVLVEVATGQKNVLLALKEWLESIKWEELQVVDVVATDFFLDAENLSDDQS